MVDTQVRLQIIAMEHAELLARRSMSWAESTNRTMMFMTLVSAAVIGLALFAQTGVSGRSLGLLALVILTVVLLLGLTTLLRIAQLDELDMRWIQGLNRLRALRLEIDPGLRQFLVSSPHDDFESVIEEYTTEGQSPAYAFGTLVILLFIVNAVLAGVVGGLAALTVLPDGSEAVVPLLVGAAATLAFVVLGSALVYRSVRDFPGRFKAMVPATPEPRAHGTAGANEPDSTLASAPDPAQGPSSTR